MASIELKDLLPGKTYNVQIRAKNSNGEYSEWSPTLAFPTPVNSATLLTNIFQQQIGSAPSSSSGVLRSASFNGALNADFSIQVDAITGQILTNPSLSGTAGWAIDYKGNAVFSNALIRGTIEAGGVLIGKNVVDTFPGIKIDSNNYWYLNGSTQGVFSLGGAQGIVYNPAVDNIIHLGSNVVVSGTVTARSFEIDQYNYWNSSTYGATNDFKVGNATNYLNWVSATSTLGISGSITSTATISGGTISGGRILGGTIEIGTAPSVFKADTSGIYLGNGIFASAPFSVTPAGVLKAESGKVGGFTLSGTSLTAGTTTSSVGMNTTGYPFWAGDPTPASAPFSVTSAGYVIAKSGTIGGWLLGVSSLTAGSGSTSVGMNITGYPFYAGNATPASAPFYVTSAGTIFSTSGTIGGWTLSASSLTAGSGSSSVGMTTTGYPFYAGNATPASAPFSVTSLGAINAKSGLVGGWTLSATDISNGTGSTKILLDAANGKITIGSGNFSSIDTGLYVDHDGKFSLANQLTFTPSLTASRTDYITTGTFSLATPTTIVVTGKTNAVTAVTTASGSATYTATGHSFIIGDKVLISNSSTLGYNGLFTITGVATNNFTVTNATTGPTTFTSGTATTTGISKGMTVTATGIDIGTTVIGISSASSTTTSVTINKNVLITQASPTTISFFLDDMSELLVTGRIKGIVESTVSITSPRLSTLINYVTVTGTTGSQIASFVTSGHAFNAGEKVSIEKLPTTNGLNNINNTVANPLYVIATAPDSTTFTISLSGVTGVTNSTVSSTIAMTNYVSTGITTITGNATSHGLVTGNRITISGATSTAANLNGTWTVTATPTANSFTFATTAIVPSGTYTSTIGSTTNIVIANLKELTMGLHPAEGISGTDSWYHSAGTGLRLDKYNWWLTNNQFRVGTSDSYFNWNGSKFVIQGGGTKTLAMSVGASDTDNYYSIANTGTTPAYNSPTTQFFVNSAGQFSLGQSLLWNGSALSINGNITSNATITGGTLSGSNISGGNISIGTAPNIFKADTNGIYLGNSTFSLAPFSVSPQGALFASNVDISGSVNATYGYIGTTDSRWSITGSRISAGEYNTFIGLQTSLSGTPVDITTTAYSIIIDNEGGGASTIYIVVDNTDLASIVAGTVRLKINPATISLALNTPETKLTDYQWTIQDISSIQYSLVGSVVQEIGVLPSNRSTIQIYGEENGQSFIDESITGLTTSLNIIDISSNSTGIWVGDPEFVVAPFSVNSYGLLTTSSGTIGGFLFQNIFDTADPSTAQWFRDTLKTNPYPGGSFISDVENFYDPITLLNPPYTIVLDPVLGLKLEVNSSLSDATSYFTSGATFPTTSSEYQAIFKGSGFAVVDNTGSASSVTINPFIGLRSESVSAINIAKNGSFEYKINPSDASYIYSSLGWVANPSKFIVTAAVTSSPAITMTNYTGNGTTVVTGKSTTAHNLVPGSIINISSTSGTEQVKLLGDRTILTTPSTTTFTFNNTTIVNAGTTIITAQSYQGFATTTIQCNATGHGLTVGDKIKIAGATGTLTVINSPASATGTIAGNAGASTITITSPTAPPTVGMTITGTGIAASTTIIGVAGSISPYTLTLSTLTTSTVSGTGTMASGTWTVSSVISANAFQFQVNSALATSTVTTGLGTLTSLSLKTGIGSTVNRIATYTATGHNLTVGESVTITGASIAGFNGTFIIKSIGSPTVNDFTIANATIGTPSVTNGLVTTQRSSLTSLDSTSSGYSYPTFPYGQKFLGNLSWTIADSTYLSTSFNLDPTGVFNLYPSPIDSTVSLTTGSNQFYTGFAVYNTTLSGLFGDNYYVAAYPIKDLTISYTSLISGQAVISPLSASNYQLSTMLSSMIDNSSYNEGDFAWSNGYLYLSAPYESNKIYSISLRTTDTVNSLTTLTIGAHSFYVGQEVVLQASGIDITGVDAWTFTIASVTATQIIIDDDGTYNTALANQVSSGDIAMYSSSSIRGKNAIEFTVPYSLYSDADFSKPFYLNLPGYYYGVTFNVITSQAIIMTRAVSSTLALTISNGITIQSIISQSDPTLFNTYDESQVTTLSNTATTLTDDAGIPVTGSYDLLFDSGNQYSSVVDAYASGITSIQVYTDQTAYFPVNSFALVQDTGEYIKVTARVYDSVNDVTTLTIVRGQLGSTAATFVTDGLIYTIERITITSITPTISSYYNFDKALYDSSIPPTLIQSTTKISNSSVGFDEFVISDSPIPYFDGSTGGGSLWSLDATIPNTWSYKPAAVIAQLGGSPTVVGYDTGFSLIKNVSYDPYTYLLDNPFVSVQKWDGDTSQSALVISGGKYSLSSTESRIELIAGTSATNGGRVNIDGKSLYITAPTNITGNTAIKGTLSSESLSTGAISALNLTATGRLKGTANYKEAAYRGARGNSATYIAAATVTLTGVSANSSVLLLVTGSFNPSTATTYSQIYITRGGSRVSYVTTVQASATGNNQPIVCSVIDAGAATGNQSYTVYMRSVNGTSDYSQDTGALRLTALELF